MNELPTRTPQVPQAPYEAQLPAPEAHAIVDADHLLAAPTGLPVSAELPVVLAEENEAKQQKLDQLKEHGRDIKLGRQIFALASEDKPEEVPVRLLPTEKATPEYKSLLRDASHEVHKNVHLALAAETNPVTGLPNRRAFDEALKNTVNEAERGGDNDVAVAILDLDGFKAVNDTRGHGFGDRVLREFGIELQAAVRESDTVMHFGGDEFAVMMPEYLRDGSEPLSKDELSRRMTERFRLAAERVTQNLGAKVGASVGIGIYEQGDTLQTLSNKADKLMYEDKVARKAGRGTEAENASVQKLLPRLRERFHRRKNQPKAAA